MTGDRVSAAFAAVPRTWFLRGPSGGGRRTTAPGHRPRPDELQPRTVRGDAAAPRRPRGRPGARRRLGVGLDHGAARAPDRTARDGARPRDRARARRGRRGNLAQGAWPWARIEPSRPHVYGDPAGAPRPHPGLGRARETRARLVDQLATDGRLVVPVAGVMLLVVMGPGGQPAVTRHGYYRFVPLRSSLGER